MPLRVMKSNELMPAKKNAIIVKKVLFCKKLSKISKKLVLILLTFMLMINSNIKVVYERMFYIKYSV